MTWLNTYGVFACYRAKVKTEEGTFLYLDATLTLEHCNTQALFLKHLKPNHHHHRHGNSYFGKLAADGSQKRAEADAQRFI